MLLVWCVCCGGLDLAKDPNGKLWKSDCRLRVYGVKFVSKRALVEEGGGECERMAGIINFTVAM